MAISQEFEYTLGANEEAIIHRKGTFVRCISAGEAFQIQGMVNQGGGADDKTEINEGIGHSLKPFDKLRVINGANPQTVKVYVGDTEVFDSRLYGSLAASIASVDGVSDASDVTLTNGAAAAQIIAANANRQTLYITNLSVTNTLRVGSSNAGASRGQPVFPQQTIALVNFDGALYGYADGANIDVSIMEITT